MIEFFKKFSQQILLLHNKVSILYYLAFFSFADEGEYQDSSWFFLPSSWFTSLFSYPISYWAKRFVVLQKFLLFWSNDSVLVSMVSNASRRARVACHNSIGCNVRYNKRYGKEWLSDWVVAHAYIYEAWRSWNADYVTSCLQQLGCFLLTFTNDNLFYCIHFWSYKKEMISYFCQPANPHSYRQEHTYTLVRSIRIHWLACCRSSLTLTSPIWGAININLKICVLKNLCLEFSF